MKEKPMDGDRGVTEMVGTILLIMMAVVAISVVSVFLFSQPVPEEVPNLDIIVTSEGGTVYLIHNGGNSLAENEFEVYFDTTLIDNGDFTVQGGDGSWPWSLGETLSYTPPSVPDSVRVIYIATGAPVLVKSSYLTGEVGTGAIDVPPTPDLTYVINIFTETLQSESVYFTRSSRGASGVFEGTMQFNISKDGSYLVINPSDPHYVLSVGDAVRIVFNTGETPDITLFMIGNKGWSLHAKASAAGGINVYVNDGPDISSNYDLTDSWITGFSDFRSTASLTAGGGNYHTRLVINNETILDEVTNDVFTLYNVTPAEPTLFVISYPASVAEGASVFFLGQVENLTRGGVEIYP